MISSLVRASQIPREIRFGFNYFKRTTRSWSYNHREVWQSAEVGFAVILLTPDDVGSSIKADTPSARARQNVIFELGYFTGKLGRGRVCLLRKGDVEIPSDLFGVIYTEMDPTEGWKARLVREMKEAGLDFDASRFWQ
jgi:predicted nucleotide-binding protein